MACSWHHVLPVDWTQCIESPLHVHVEMPKTVLPPELHQVHPAVPPCVRDLLEGSHLSVHAPLSNPSSFPLLQLSIRHRPRRKHTQGPVRRDATERISYAHICRDVHVPHDPVVSARVVSPFAGVSVGLLSASLNVP